MNTSLASPSARFNVLVLSYLEPDGGQRLAAFRSATFELFRRHDVRVERTLVGKGKGQLVGANPWDVPDVIQLLSSPSLAAFQAYTADPQYKELAVARDQGIRRMVAALGTPRDVSQLNPTSESAAEGRLYGVAFVNFKESGAERMDEFNRRGVALFRRHGMHVEATVDVIKTITPRGLPLDGFAPERVVMFYLDDPTRLKSYVGDPEYQELAPLRDAGLSSYDFFLAGVPS